MECILRRLARMPLLRSSEALPSHAADETDMDEDCSLGSFTSVLLSRDVGTVVSQRRIGLHR